MVQLSPDTDTIGYGEDGHYNKKVYGYCAGYQYDDPTIAGFSHTRFSGTGHSGLGDYLIMPTIVDIQLNPGTADHPENGYRSAFDKKKEPAEPGYYRMKLDDGSITCELTATERVGFHRYSFPETEDAHIIPDLMPRILGLKANYSSFIRACLPSGMHWRLIKIVVVSNTQERLPLSGQQFCFLKLFLVFLRILNTKP